MTICISVVYKGDKIITLTDSRGINQNTGEIFDDVPKTFYSADEKRQFIVLMSSGYFVSQEIYPFFEEIENKIDIRANDTVYNLCEKVFDGIKQFCPKTFASADFQFQICGFDGGQPRIWVHFITCIKGAHHGTVTGTKIIVDLFTKKYQHRINEVRNAGSLDEAVKRIKTIATEAVEEENHINKDRPTCNTNFKVGVISP